MTESDSLSTNGRQEFPHWRVKVFRCVDGQTWDELGTGYIVQNGEYGFAVASETEDRVIYDWEVDIELSYAPEDDTLLSWREMHDEDLALSFETQENRDAVQRHFELAKARLVETIRNQLVSVKLPEPTRENIALIKEKLDLQLRTQRQRDTFSDMIERTDYISELSALHEECEKLNDHQCLLDLGDVMRRIVMMSNTNLLQYLGQKSVTLSVAGMLEYDSEYPNTKGEFRKMLEHSKFVEVIPINDPSILQRVHENYRLQFLKDIVLPRSLDDITSAMLSSIIMFNNVDILTYFQSKPESLRDMIDLVKKRSKSKHQRVNALRSLQSLCMIAKSTQTTTRDELYRSLAQNGLFDALETVIEDISDEKQRTTVFGILAMVLEYDASLLRNHILAQAKHSDVTFLDHLITTFHVCSGGYLVGQLAEMLKMLLDTNVAESNPIRMTVPVDPRIGEFLNYFYEQKLLMLVKPLLDIDEPQMRDDVLRAEKLCDLLRSAIQGHSEMVKLTLLSSNLPVRVALLLSNRQQQLCGSALRVIREMIGAKDDFYIRYIIKNEIVAQILTLAERCRLLNNANYCACLEFFENIISLNSKSLLRHAVERLSKQGGQLAEEPVFKELRRQLERNIHDSDSGTASALGSQQEEDGTRGYRGRRDGWSSSTMDEHEEAYFNTADEDDSEDESDMDQKSSDLGAESPAPVGISAQFADTLKMAGRKRSWTETDTGASTTTSFHQRKRSILDDDDDDDDEGANDDGNDSGGGKRILPLHSAGEDISHRQEDSPKKQELSGATGTTDGPLQKHSSSDSEEYVSEPVEPHDAALRTRDGDVHEQ
ncbi:component of IIS longevity pathway SMK-1-domain-containing protein [Thamnocephalis sphaerospora]|uniref:Component of IIS longevity pathway SMK-1-domain-containing protein n=1 Tax=Thamnocephalis sphaerospora TaxID=78915 RepID=A0A4P9XU65_9FUNG|nr:component of IIS longevity pathway SMK-1-domain-containing protein [Thamnocephalis sphaerospora]|eukprot:RKP09121.1 component of IIS longevity pathway SMK-1-domain-containing protein [Thamnocephalis sphaerospora]